MNKAKLIIIGIAFFVYTLSVIGLTTLIVHPGQQVEKGTPLTEKDIENMCDKRDGVGF